LRLAASFKDWHLSSHAQPAVQNGENGKDDGGDTTPLPGKTSLRNLWDRKDFVWPSPALPEEIEAYRTRRGGDY
jgi:hypothetical protein